MKTRACPTCGGDFLLDGEGKQRVGTIRLAYSGSYRIQRGAPQTIIS